MHSLGYVHRDIKPQNIFLKQNENGDLTVKLGDFGSAHPLNDEMTTNISGAKGNQGVTVLYSAPEVHQGISYGRKSDIWSIGCTVFHMITGRVPWSKGGVRALEASAVIYQMYLNHNPLEYFGPLEPFTDHPHFTADATHFMNQ
jgi:serine/threonine protein kinase